MMTRILVIIDDWDFYLQEWAEDLFGSPSVMDCEECSCWISLRRLPSHVWTETSVKWAVHKFGSVLAVGESLRRDTDHEHAMVRTACAGRHIIPQLINAAGWMSILLNRRLLTGGQGG